MPSAPLCPGRLTQYQKKAFSPLRPLITPQVTVHIHHDLDILKYHRHFPLSQSPLNLYTALKKFPLQKTRLKRVREKDAQSCVASLRADKAASLEMCKLYRNLWLVGRQFTGLRHGAIQRPIFGGAERSASSSSSSPMIPFEIVRRQVETVRL